MNLTSAVLESVPEPVVEYEFQGGTPVIKRINDAFAEEFGVTAIDARERPLEGILEAGANRRPIEIERRTGRYESDVRRYTSEGWRAFHLRIVPLREADRQLATYCQVSLREHYDQKLEALHEATRALIKRDTKEEVAETAVDAAVDILGLPATSVHLVDHDRGVLPPTVTTEAVREMIGDMPDLPIEDSLAGKVLTTGEPIVYNDPSERPDIYNPDTQLKSELIMPLGSHGVLMSAATEHGAFADIHESLASILASNTEAALDRIEREEMLARRERELAEQNERLEAFASMVSHDLRNPLNVAQGHREMAQVKEDLSFLEKVEEAHDRMEALIEDLLELARQGDERGEVETLSVLDVAEEAWSQVRTERAELVTEGTIGTIEADRSRLAAVFENLFRNSIEHGDVLTVRVGASDRGFYVADDGPGIPPEERDSVFEAGYTDAKDGTGMGLAIVKEITQAHGWDVAVDESREGGARFEFDVGNGDCS